MVLFMLSAGYVAVSKPLGKEEKRDIVVVFRGTQAITEWASDFVWEMQPWDELETGRDAVKIAKASSNLPNCAKLVSAKFPNTKPQQ